MAVSTYWHTQDQSIAVLAASLTRYVPCAANGPIQYRTDETYAQVRVQTAGTFSGLCVKLLLGSRLNATVTLRVNGVDTALTVTFSAVGTYTDDVHTVDVVAGDLVDYEIFSGAGGASNYAFPSIGIVFTAAKALTLTCAGNEVGVGFSAASVTTMVGIGGEIAVATAANEAFVAVNLHGSGTLRNFSTMISTNARSTASVFTVRKNGADTALTFTVAGSGVQRQEDTTHSVTFADGDTLTIGIALGTGAGTLLPYWICLGIESDSGLFWSIAGVNNGILHGQGTTRSYPLTGTLIAQATEANGQFQHRAIGASATRIGARTSTNTLSVGCPLTLRKGGADSAQSVPIGTGAGTGWIEDTTPDAAVSIADGNLFNHRAVAAAGAGSITIVLLVMEFTAQVTAQTFLKTVTGSLSFAGTVGRQKAFKRTLPGSLSFTSVLTRRLARPRARAGVLSFTSTLGRLKAYRRTLTGVLRFTSVLGRVKSATRTLTGQLQLQGVVKRLVAKRITGVLSFTGSLRRTVAKRVSGVLSMTSTLGRLKSFKRARTGVLSFASTLTHLFAPGGPVGKQLFGVLSFQGAVKGTVSKRLTAALSFTGALKGRTLRTLVGTLRFTSTLGRLKAASKPLAGVLSFSSTLGRVKSAGKLLAGVLWLQGAVSKRTAVRRLGVLAFQSTLSRGAALKRTLTGGLAFSSVLTGVKQAGTFFKALTGILSFGPSTLTREYTDNPEPVAGPDPWLVRLRRRWGGK